MTHRSISTLAVGFVMLLAPGASAGAAEIKVMASNALKSTAEELIPAFEKIQWS